MEILVLPVFILIFILFLIHSKIKFLELRDGSKKLKATVVEYSKERGSMRNDYTLLNYPYLRILLDDAYYVKQKLRYANNWNKPFEIGQEIDVFWLGSDLLYWDAYDTGFYNYLPSKWSFWT
ncbi:hypothetical protein [Leeuwenhoekiella parthenopeia]|uniref:Uncharacterized protein n=1 Tax=Leeuwenhoekiella parthenopeia TaxID=2890320 RepID=A0ABS8GPY4_9FLAO|nr:hypothetical protein [Leeuwenhoekiella parthenopeia]MCC4212030.1 hypothetical protein [Leeuwenhoekiella parthenopeia]